MTSGWGCPYEDRGTCRKVAGKDCDPGMKGCILSGKVRFSVPEKDEARVIRERVATRKAEKD